MSMEKRGATPIFSLMSNATRRPSGESTKFSGKRDRDSCF
jgi:hypothetical protein